jgi:endonuclease/exonuclease/phosphatase family metal-dependent hydrolase
MSTPLPRIRIVTYNVHKCRGLDRRTDVDRIAGVIHQLDADVVALQEVLDVRNGKPEFDQARRLAGQFGGKYWRFGENRHLHGGLYGNMTMSRFPATFARNYDLSWRRRERRGCLRTDLQIANNLQLHVFNVHLGTGFLERRQQAKRLASADVLKQSTFTGPRVVVGDFNEWTRGLATRLMGEHFRAAEPFAFLRYKRTYPGIFPLLHLDHFYYDEALSLVSVRLHRSRTALVASDHLPLVAEFEIPQSTSS